MKVVAEVKALKILKAIGTTALIIIGSAFCITSLVLLYLLFAWDGND